MAPNTSPPASCTIGTEMPNMLRYRRPPPGNGQQQDAVDGDRAGNRPTIGLAAAAVKLNMIAAVPNWCSRRETTPRSERKVEGEAATAGFCVDGKWVAPRRNRRSRGRRNWSGRTPTAQDQTGAHQLMCPRPRNPREPRRSKAGPGGVDRVSPLDCASRYRLGCTICEPDGSCRHHGPARVTITAYNCRFSRNLRGFDSHHPLHLDSKT